MPSTLVHDPIGCAVYTWDKRGALCAVARHFDDPELMERTRKVVKEELEGLLPELTKYKTTPAKKLQPTLAVPSRLSHLLKNFVLLAWTW